MFYVPASPACFGLIDCLRPLDRSSAFMDVGGRHEERLRASGRSVSSLSLDDGVRNDDLRPP